MVSAGSEPTPDIDGLVDLSGPIAYGDLDSQSAAARVDQPVLVIRAPNDADGPSLQEADALLDAMPSTDKQHASAVGFPGAHGWGLLGEPGAWTPYASHVENFIEGR